MVDTEVLRENGQHGIANEIERLREQVVLYRDGEYGVNGLAKRIAELEAALQPLFNLAWSRVADDGFWDDNSIVAGQFTIAELRAVLAALNKEQS